MQKLLYYVNQKKKKSSKEENHSAILSCWAEDWWIRSWDELWEGTTEYLFSLRWFGIQSTPGTVTSIQQKFFYKCLLPILCKAINLSWTKSCVKPSESDEIEWYWMLKSRKIKRPKRTQSSIIQRLEVVPFWAAQHPIICQMQQLLYLWQHHMGFFFFPPGASFLGALRRWHHLVQRQRERLNAGAHACMCACVCVDTLTLTLCAGWSVWVESRDYKQNQCCTDACALLIHETTDLKQNKRTQSIAWTQNRTNSLRTVHKAASFSDTPARTKRKRLPSAN